MMDFSLSDEQRMIADTTAQVMEDHGLPGSRPGDPGALWRALAGLELLGLPFPESVGGAGLGVSDLVFALIEAGRFGADAPLVSSVLLPALCLRMAGPQVLPATLSAALIAGRETLGAAFDDAPGAALRATAQPGGHLLHGRKVACLGAGDARMLLIVAGEGADASVFLGAADTPGITREAYALVDGRAAADLHFEGVSLPERARIGGPELAVLLRDAGALALAADALGAMRRINAMTLEHLKTRRQFGQPIGKFQVLQHKMVDMIHETEHLTSLVYLAAMACDVPGTAAESRAVTDHRAGAVSRLRRHLATRIRPAAASAIQLHGGIGMTADYVLGALVKRVLVADMLFGSADDHAARLRRLLADDASTQALA